jgi:hypothetical protein
MRPANRAARGLSLLVIAMVVLAGCAGGQPQPRGYGEPTTDGSGYFGNFMLGCTGVEPNEDGDYEDVRYESQEYCRCVFDGLSDPGGVPFSEVQAFEDAQGEADDPSEITVPRNIQRVMDGCANESVRS